MKTHTTNTSFEQASIRSAELGDTLRRNLVLRTSRMTPFFRKGNFWIMLLADMVILGLCYLAAGLIRFEGTIPPTTLHQMLVNIFPMIAAKVLCFFLFDLYRGMWRYTGIRDLLSIMKATLAGTLLYISFLALFEPFKLVSRGVILIDFLLTVVCIGGFRLAIRLYHQRDSAFMDELMFWRKALSARKNVLIVGTGPDAEKLMREIHEGRVSNAHVVGFIEMEDENQGMKIHGIPILGSMLDLPRVIAFYGIEDIFIADPCMKARDVRTLIETFGGSRVRFKVVPTLQERMTQGVFDSLRDIKLEDLMERDQIHVDMGVVRAEIEGRCVAVTGAGGSIGSELCRQILRYAPETLILIDNAETPLYEIDMELSTCRPEGSAVRVIPCIGDVRSRRSIERIFRKYRPQVVYHAAAYKHVPMMELAPVDAVNNNVIGTFKVASLACRYHVKKFILISTDKAVRPTSVMGATKRVAELVVQALGGNGTRFIVVRFGNVLGSNGSVVPLFQQQIASGGPVTVTHPEITRYFMTIPEAVMLVLQAGAMGSGGELFLLDMGRPVRIADLARNMIRLSGLVPDRDVRITYIGLRPGEKLYEELLIEGEGVVDTPYEKIKVCSTCSKIDEERLFEGIEHMNLLMKNAGDADAALSILGRLVPDFRRETGGTRQEARVDAAAPDGSDTTRPVEY
ncbi:MAG TPA: nucleoside-diphosphate sugar epimerase/dehydratase [Deltaproteobacteria bacterium]|nr:nucleoside-diphosphate sugar epimerase/dehydratase [Deltaproteobacteria bacterium]HPR56679.1 nucleoside-diphosphate sugar epimerase/dehydratase [Deltaproteobacteria bacterium]